MVIGHVAVMGRTHTCVSNFTLMSLAKTFFFVTGHRSFWTFELFVIFQLSELYIFYEILAIVAMDRTFICCSFFSIDRQLLSS